MNAPALYWAPWGGRGVGPTEDYPREYSSGAFGAAGSRFIYWLETLKLMLFGPLPTDEQLRDEIADWLSFTLSEDGN